MALVALAMKSMAPFSLAITFPAARVWAVVEPGFTFGIGKAGGPPGFEPPTVTSILRARGFVATQFRKKAAQLACFALAAIPNVNGADIAACFPPGVAGGIRKKPTLAGICLSRLPDSQSPSKMSSPSLCWNLLIMLK